MNDVQAQKQDQQVRILGRKIGREISPVEADHVTGGAQSFSAIYSRSTGTTTYDDNGIDKDQ